MRVVHIIRWDGGGGAAMGAHRLHRSLQRLGIDSTIFVAEKLTADPTVTQFRPSSRLLSRLRRRIRRQRIRASWRRYRPVTSFTDDRVAFGREVLEQLPSGDVLHVHGTSGFVDFSLFFRLLPRRIPVVRTMHDMNFFTGGCHNNGGCDKFAGRCGACPQLGSHREHDLSRRIWERKRRALDMVPRDRLHVVAPSRWLANEARRSSLLSRFDISVIPLGIDVDTLAPMDRHAARAVLRIPTDASVLLFVATQPNHPLKGFAYLAAALEKLDLPDIFVVSVGNEAPLLGPGIKRSHLGRITDQRLLALAYNAADLLIVPSLQESFCQVVLEALACGTPVVASGVGGIPEMVRTGVNGSLVSPRDVGGLGAAIRSLLADRPRLEQMREHCRPIVLDEYSLDLVARRYADLYQALCQSSVKPFAGVERR